MAFPVVLHAQQDTLHVSPQGATHVPAPQDQGAAKVYTIVDQMPQFQGGEAAMFAYLAGAIRYPSEAASAGASGVVYTTFVVQEDGSLRDVTLLRGAHPLLDEEALRVVRAMPAWEPGKHKSQVCCVQFNLPIRFSLGRSHDDEVKAEMEQLPQHGTERLASIPPQTPESSPEVVIRAPSFKGGEEKMSRFIASNIEYPVEARDRGIAGTVYLKFLVHPDGTLGNMEVLRSPHPLMSEEAQRVISAMPRWVPGECASGPCTLSVLLPIKFSLHRPR